MLYYRLRLSQTVAIFLQYVFMMLMNTYVRQCFFIMFVYMLFAVRFYNYIVDRTLGITLHRSYFRSHAVVGLRYGSPPDAVLQLRREAERFLRPGQPDPQVDLHAHAAPVCRGDGTLPGLVDPSRG